VTTLWGIVVYWYFPSSPQTAKFLTDEEKRIALNRLAANKTGTKNSDIKFRQIVEAIDPRKDPTGILFFFRKYFRECPSGCSSYLLTVTFFNEFPNGGFGNFFALTISSLGFDKLQTSLMGIPVGAAQVFWMLGLAYPTLKFPNLRIWMAL